MKNHPVIILIVVVLVIAAILYFIASGKANTALTGTLPTTTQNGGIVFPLLRSANDATVNPVAVRYLGTGRPSLM